MSKPGKAVQSYLEIDPNKIESAKGWNPRSQFEKQALDELAADIEANGIIEPLIVRKIGAGKYQVIAGERRLRAAKKVKLKTVPTIVREMEDLEAYQVTMSENANRVDLHAIEEARGFATQRDRYKMPLKEIARRSGKSLPYVVNRLQLATLSKEVAEMAFEAGDKLPLGHLQAVAQIGDDTAQKKFLHSILHPPYSRNGEVMSYDMVKRELAEYQRALSEAQFAPAEIGLTSAPPCGECRQNTTNLPREVFPRKDLCTNVGCFAQKQKARLVQITTKGDYKPLKVAFSQYNSGAPDGYLDLSQTNYSSGNGNRTYESWFKEFKGEYCPTKYAVFNPNSKRIVFVVKREEATRAMSIITRKLQGNFGKGKSASSPSYSGNNQDGVRENKAKERALETLVSRVMEDWAGSDPKKTHRAALVIFRALNDEPGLRTETGYAKLAEKRGVGLTDAEKKKAGQYGQDEAHIKKLYAWIQDQPFEEQLGLLLELAASGASTYAFSGDAFTAKEVGEEYGFDFDEQVKAHKKLIIEEEKQAKAAKKEKTPAAAAAAGA